MAGGSATRVSRTRSATEAGMRAAHRVRPADLSAATAFTGSRVAHSTTAATSADSRRMNGEILRILLRFDGQLRGQQTLRLVLRNVRAIHNIRNELRTKR